MAYVLNKDGRCQGVFQTALNALLTIDDMTVGQVQAILEKLADSGDRYTKFNVKYLTDNKRPIQPTYELS